MEILGTIILLVFIAFTLSFTYNLAIKIIKEITWGKFQPISGENIFLYSFGLICMLVFLCLMIAILIGIWL